MDSNITLSSRDDIKLISSPDWPDPYPYNAVVTIVINSPDNSTIKITIFNLQVQCGSLVFYDGLFNLAR